jgi:hypothetical protein
MQQEHRKLVAALKRERARRKAVYGKAQHLVRSRAARQRMQLARMRMQRQARRAQENAKRARHRAAARRRDVLR